MTMRVDRIGVGGLLEQGVWGWERLNQSQRGMVSHYGRTLSLSQAKRSLRPTERWSPRVKGGEKRGPEGEGGVKRGFPATLDVGKGRLDDLTSW